MTKNSSKKKHAVSKSSKTTSGRRSIQLKQQDSITGFLLDSDRFCRSPSPSARPNPEPDCWSPNKEEESENSNLERTLSPSDNGSKEGSESFNSGSEQDIKSGEKSTEDDMYSKFNLSMGFDGLGNIQEEQENEDDKESSNDESENVESGKLALINIVNILFIFK